MKKIVQIVSMLFFITGIFAQNRSNTVNPLIGDESFIALFGLQPAADTDDHLRILTHLCYAEYKLRQKTAQGLNEQQKQNREMVLNHLHDYWTNGVFPANLDYPDERRPCFIDKNGNICAVGYLVEKTAGIELARQINEKHQYDYLMDMNEPALAAWAEEHGFTLEECATIQPTYGPPPPDVITNMPITKGYGISSGVVGGFNLAVNTINFSGRFGNVKAVSFLGIMSGATQIILGVSNIKKDVSHYTGWDQGARIESYKAQNNLSYVNIAVGTTTVVTSAINLFLNNKIKDKKTVVGLYSYQGLNNEMNLGLSYARKL